LVIESILVSFWIRRTATARIAGKETLSRASIELPSLFTECLLTFSRYSTAFANRLADLIHELEPSADASIGFICSPTAFVAFKHLHPQPKTRLLEVDQRFAVLAPAHYVPYDMNEPDNFPGELKNSFDLIVVDPPFLNEVSFPSGQSLGRV
jgi:hypothetical protein